MEPKSPSKSKLQITGFYHNPRLRKSVIIPILIFLILGAIGCYLILKERITMSDRMNTYFAVVIDCGSTGSRVNVFEWQISNGSEVYGNLPTLLHSYPENVNKSDGCRYHCLQTEPGLHNFINNASGVRGSLEPLIRYAEKQVPLERCGGTPIFVLATAGMRRLGAENAARVLNDVENVVRDHGFLSKRNWIRVLSGKEEAYYGWVALNYRMGVFGSKSKLPTLGLLDLGGSSLQVVAEQEDAVQDEHGLRSKIGRVEHDIVAYSLPAFGLNEAFDRTVDMLSHTAALRESVGGAFEVRHPCLGSGFVQNYTCRGCFGSDSRVRSSINNNVGDVILVGEPNWEKCEVIARAAAINSSSSEWSEKVYHSNCIGLFSYGGNAKLNLSKPLHAVSRYHALSGFFAVSTALNLSQNANLTALWDSGKNLCLTSWSDQKSINAQHCFRVPYLASLIENALCLGGVDIIFGPGDVSWTLGASLIEGDFLWLHDDKSRNSILTLRENMTVHSPLLVFVLLLFLLLVVYCCQLKLPMPGRKVAGGTRASLPSYLCPKRQSN